MMDDLKNYKGDLFATQSKWQKILGEDITFIDTLCKTLYNEDKLQAIP